MQPYNKLNYHFYGVPETLKKNWGGNGKNRKEQFFSTKNKKPFFKYCLPFLIIVNV